jgi:tRNA(Ile2) C34 agmatinyltransferase TiaS
MVSTVVQAESYNNILVQKGLVSLMKKRSLTICRSCGREFRGRPGAYRCTSCKEKENQYRAQRERMKRSLPYYLKADI